LILSFFVCFLLIIIVFNLPSNTKSSGFYKWDNIKKDSSLSIFGIFAILIFIFQILSNIHYIVRFSIKKDNSKRIRYLVMFSFILALSVIVFIFGATNRPEDSTSIYQTCWIYKFYNDTFGWQGFEFTTAGYVMVSLTSITYILGIVAAYLLLKKNIKIKIIRSHKKQ
jgi:hypothetical protein